MSIQASTETQLIIPASITESLEAAPKISPLDQSILEIAKTLQENSDIFNRKLFLSVKKSGVSHDSAYLSYPIAQSEKKLHLFANPNGNTVRVYVSSRKAEDKDPEECIIGASKLCTTAQRYEINSKNLEVSAPLDVTRLRIRPDHSAEKHERIAEKINRECKFYNALSSIPQVCKLFDYAIYKGTRKGYEITKATQYLETYPCNLYEYNEQLIDCGLQIDERKKYLYPLFSELLIGLEALHSKNLVHSDMKPDNLVVKEDKCVIIDFEYAQRMGRFDTRFCGGTRSYYAPEMNVNIENRINEKEWTSLASDIWAAGLVFWDLVTDSEHPLVLMQQELGCMKKLLEGTRSIMNEIAHDFPEVSKEGDVKSSGNTKYLDMLCGAVFDFTGRQKIREKSLKALSPDVTASLSAKLNDLNDQESKLWIEKREHAMNLPSSIYNDIDDDTCQILYRFNNIPNECLLSHRNQKLVTDLLNDAYRSINDVREMLKTVLRETYLYMRSAPAYNDPFLEMVRRMLDPDPTTRFTAKEGLKALEIIIAADCRFHEISQDKEDIEDDKDIKDITHA